MIPSIQDILMGLLRGDYTAAQCEAWINTHIELGAENAELQLGEPIHGCFDILDDTGTMAIALGVLPEYAARIVQCVNAHDDLVAAATQAARWIAQEMDAKGWPGERIANPPEGSHLFNLRAAIAKAAGSAA